MHARCINAPPLGPVEFQLSVKWFARSCPQPRTHPRIHHHHVHRRSFSKDMFQRVQILCFRIQIVGAYRKHGNCSEILDSNKFGCGGNSFQPSQLGKPDVVHRSVLGFSLVGWGIKIVCQAKQNTREKHRIFHQHISQRNPRRMCGNVKTENIGRILW